MSSRGSECGQWDQKNECKGGKPGPGTRKMGEAGSGGNVAFPPAEGSSFGGGGAQLV